MHTRSAENAEKIKNPYLPGRRYTTKKGATKEKQRIRSNLDIRVEKFKERE